MLLEYLPDYYKNSEVFKQLLGAFAVEINANGHSIMELENQLFIDTATWGLDVWEKQLGIYADLSKPYSERQEIIKAKMRGSGTCTIEMIKNTALAYTNAEVEIIEKNSEYAFIVKFIGKKGVPPNIEDFKNTIEQVKPAHLAFTLEYTYLTWGEFDNYNKSWGEWDNLNLTWDEFQEYLEG